LSPFDPKAKYHLLIERPGHDADFLSFETIQALCKRAEKSILSAQKSGYYPKMRVVVGSRCPISAGPLPKVLVEGKWLALLEDRSVTIDDCPEDGSIFGKEEPVVTTKEVEQLDLEGIPAKDAEEGEFKIRPQSVEADEEGGKALQIFNQSRA
jgi:hypothetical protein